MVRNINTINLFPHYKAITEEDLVFAPVREVATDRKNNELLKTLFAPDPDSGLPRSDLQIVYSKDAAPEVAQFIRDNLMSPLPDVANIDDPDIALQAIRNPGERFTDYANRLRSLCEESLKNVKTE